MPVSVDPTEAVTLTRDLVRFNTTNPPGDETPVIRLLEERLRADGFETVTIPYLVGENRSQLVARLRGSGERPGLLFSGHVDVVPPGNVPWTVEVFGGEIREGRLYGRGSCDMKSGVAALVVAAGAIARSGLDLRGDLVVAITADEERNCLGADELVKEPLFEGVGAALVAEPTALRLYVAEKGAFWVEVTISGKTAHGSMPQLGANAVASMAEFLHRWEQTYKTDDPVHPILGSPTLNVGVIQGGVKVNVVPDQCTVQLDMRTVPPLDHGDLERAMGELLNEICARRGTRWELGTLSNRPSVSCPADSDLAQAIAGAISDLGQIDPAPRGIPYCTEACVWVPQLRIPAVICGPGSPGMAHQPDEYVAVAEIELATLVYTRVAAALLGG